jgi:hypothetical protein
METSAAGPTATAESMDFQTAGKGTRIPSYALRDSPTMSTLGLGLLGAILASPAAVPLDVRAKCLNNLSKTLSSGGGHGQGLAVEWGKTASGFPESRAAWYRAVESLALLTAADVRYIHYILIRFR